MDYLIVYFSGTGNTWLLAKEMERRFRDKGKNVECYSIENEVLTLEKILNAEHLIIGYPIYGSEAPAPMKQFINTLPTNDVGKKLSIFCTQAYMSGDGANYLEKLLSAKNYNLLHTEEFKMSNNFYVPVFIRAFPVGDQKKIDKRNAKAFRRLDSFIENISNENYSVKHVGFMNQLLGNSQRKHIGKYITKVNEALLVDENCTKCGLCVKLCPMNNIQLNDIIHFQTSCSACMRCYQACPVSAIQITEKSRDLSKYPRFKGPISKFNFTILKN